MFRYFIKRLVMMLVAMFFIILLTFLMMHAVPGGPFTSDKKLSPQIEEAMNEKYHLNDPLPVQFKDYLVSVLHGDFGPSYKYPGKTVNGFIEQGFPVSAKLGFITILFVLLAAIPMGIVAAVKNGKWQDMLLMALATIGVTIPSFVIASLLIYFFAFRLNWLPTYGIDSWKGYVLPVIALGGYSVSYIARLMRSSLLEVMGQDYIRTARAKGLSEFRVITRHALRNALIPVITVLGPTIANLMTGSFVIEKIFAIPGLGVYFVNSVSQRDYTTIMGVTIFYAAFLMVMVLIVDLFYCMIDPRIKYD
ncbi:MAG: ABC transporter permease [Lachnospiraceae bacterium]|jgi:oligopeptide transport system permease protein|nr:ABC transporter permease [Lachnospiraceae bacterium]MDY6287622.1 ABC transporter permease [Lachnospiraceae bacterium]MDY6334179.1 ABC transporter permease [Lachnospiraceae bacterium]